MESSFKKGYDKTVNADGSFELSFKSRRLSPKTSASMGTLMIFVLFPVSCAVTLPVAGMFLSPRQDLADVNKFLWNALAFTLLFILLYLVTFCKTRILVKPDVGISFGGKNLPFKEISEIGTLDHPYSANKKGAACVYANTNATQVNISKYIPLALAEAVAEEIKKSSGMGWA
jgi:hypothetical protein